MSDEAFLWFKLFSARGFGAKSINLLRQTMREKGLSLEQVLSLSKVDFASTFHFIGTGRLSKATYANLQDHSQDEILWSQYEGLKRLGAQCIHLGHDSYPQLLKGRMDCACPPILFCMGRMSLLSAPSIAIVGSRNASAEGLQMAETLAGELAHRGFNIISGYAKGIDTSSHLGALKADGTTTIVLSYGLVEFSRKESLDRKSWRDSTLVLSQFAPRERWSAGNAMTRNKLVCGMARAIVIIESGPERDPVGRMSGSFDAGRTSLAMRVPLFVISPTSFRRPPAGNERLLKIGAQSIEPATGAVTIQDALGKSAEQSKSESERRDQLPLFSTSSIVKDSGRIKRKPE